jgi:murein DD-endopeptidase MepM/ murein hydrolase activator NlpD
MVAHTVSRPSACATGLRQLCKEARAPGQIARDRPYGQGVLALAVALTLVPPVSGAVMRGFDYADDPYARGHHRGIDLAAAPGDPVRAACSGRVTFAGRAGTNGKAVTIRCGRWSVTHLPLATIDTRAGAALPAGTPLGTAGATHRHAGLHLGVRRSTDPHGYIDPAPLLRTPPRPAPPVAPRAITRRTAPSPPHPAPLPAARTAPGPRAGSSPLAPWPAWAGLALLLAGTTGAGAARRARRRCAPAAGGVPRAGTVSR